MKLKISKLILIICLVTSSSMIASAPDLGGYKYDGKWSSKTDEFIKLALEDTAIPFRAEYSPLVKKWIKRHTIRGKKTFEKMLGKSAYYFPIFEHYLDTYELPKELKFLAMVESGLFPKIESSAGAVGLWQFMPGTADFYKLTINEWVDERKSPYRSSEAAAKMLSDLYNQFGDWKLVLAAYNCGPGRVSRAIRKSGSNDYEAIKRRLPKQTQEYVIKYIATAFVGTHFEAFGMQPVKQMIEVEKTTVVKVYDWLSLEKLSKVAEVSLNEIMILNPSFAKSIIPKTQAGNYVVLPQDGALKLEDYFNDNGFVALDYVHRQPERIEELEPEPEVVYWVSANVKPIVMKPLFQWSFQSFFQWGKSWSFSVLNSLQQRHFW